MRFLIIIFGSLSKNIESRLNGHFIFFAVYSCNAATPGSVAFNSWTLSIMPGLLDCFFFVYFLIFIPSRFVFFLVLLSSHAFHKNSAPLKICLFVFHSFFTYDNSLSFSFSRRSLWSFVLPSQDLRPVQGLLSLFSFASHKKETFYLVCRGLWSRFAPYFSYGLSGGGAELQLYFRLFVWLCFNDVIIMMIAMMSQE